MMEDAFIPSASAPGRQDEPAWWFVFREQRLLVSLAGSTPGVPLLTDIESLELSPRFLDHLGTISGVHCYAAIIPETAATPPQMDFRNVRHLFGLLDEGLYRVVIRALGVVNWAVTHQFCGGCGTKTVRPADILARQCPACNLLVFPRISPAIIVLVERENKVLLAHAGKFQDEMYSVIAGFVDPGETLEEAVKREVREEIGIDVENVRYFGSQPWPFPDSLMIAFTAQHCGGEISVDGEEIMHAAWFEADKLPRIPEKISIARSLIDWFLAKQRLADG